LNLDLTDDQEMLRDMFARFLDEHSSVARVRAAMPSGFDPALWQGLAELGAFSLRVPEEVGGLGLGLFDAAILMDEAGRTLVSGPLAETLVTARLLAALGQTELLEKVTSGTSIVTLAFHDIAKQPVQWVAGGAVAESVVALRGEEVVLVSVANPGNNGEETLASTPIAEIDLGANPPLVLGSGAAKTAFLQAVEEWKLLVAAALSGLSREAVRVASAYASEREAFGQKIGTYQGISHPLADSIVDIDGGKLLMWRTIRALADGSHTAGAETSLSLWWNADMATRAVARALHAFGGYGLTTEYDVHLFNLRAKAWPLAFGDPQQALYEAGRRLYAGETVAVPDTGEVSIDFDIGDEARALAKEVDAFFTENLTPELKAKAHYSFDGHDAGIHKKLAEKGLLFPAYPTRLGGRGAPPYSVSAAAAVWEDHEWTGHVKGVAEMVGLIIDRYGSDELKAEVLTKIVSGEAICSLGYSEPGSGSDVFAAKTRATPDGNGWRIDGSKMFTSGANLADYVLMLTRTNADVPKHKGLTMFIVPLKAPGVEIQPVYTFQDERTNITYYDGVKIPDSWRLGDVDAGVKVMSAGLELEHGGGFTKTQEHMLRAGVKLCKELVRDGKPLIEHPNAQARLAKAHASVAISEVLGHRSLWSAVEKKPNLAYGPMIKLFSSEKFVTDSADLLDLTAPDSLSKRKGPAGFLNQCYRHAQGTTIYGGTSEVHRSMIAERGLGLPRSRG
jgi:alkylation response protein AidB-like acyl-CoA dehydrogenase